MQIKKKSTKYSFPANELNKNGTAYKKNFLSSFLFQKKSFAFLLDLFSLKRLYFIVMRIFFKNICINF